MSRLAAMFEKHYREHLPTAHAAVKDPETFYASLATEAQEQIDSLELALRGPDPETETFAERTSRYAQARQAAEATVVREMMPPPENRPETQDGPEDQEITEALSEFQTLRETLYDQLDAR